MSIWKVPRLTTAQRLLLTPEASELIYDTTSQTYWGGNGVTVGGIPLGSSTGSVESPTLFYGSPTTSLTTVESGDRVVRATVLIQEAFNGVGAAVTVGTDTNPELVVGLSDIEVSSAGTYEVFPLLKFNSTETLKVFITPGTLATTGEVFITLDLGG